VGEEEGWGNMCCLGTPEHRFGTKTGSLTDASILEDGGNCRSKTEKNGVKCKGRSARRKVARDRNAGSNSESDSKLTVVTKDRPTQVSHEDHRKEKNK